MSNSPECGPVERTFTAFADGRCLGSGELAAIAELARLESLRDGTASVLVFDDATGSVTDLDLRGTARDVRTRYAPVPHRESEPEEVSPPRPGRPKLGVVAREVTLLPRHWEWLGEQPGGASVALRKLVEEARRASAGRDRVRKSREACYRVMSALAGNAPGFEEASRALFAGDRAKFARETRAWPAEVRAYARRLAGRGWNDGGAA